MFGANLESNGDVTVKVWAPNLSRLSVVFPERSHYTLDLEPSLNGFYSASSGEIGPGDEYFLKIDSDTLRPDPVSRFLPKGVHGPTSNSGCGELFLD